MTSNIGLPPRVQIVIGDSESGSYPVTSRVGDDSRSGRYSVVFDDTRVIEFKTGIRVSYPSLLNQGSRFLNTSNSSSLEVSSGIIRKNIADDFVVFNNPGEQLSPFNEAKKLEISNCESMDPFHMTGSSIEDVGPGFSTRLASKTRIEIDLTPAITSTLSIKNGTVELVDPDGVGAAGNPKAGNWDFDGRDSYPMGYFNFSERRWEGVGRGIATSISGTQGYLWSNAPTGSVNTNLANSMYGFSPSYALVDAATEGLQAAIPFTNFGFPMSPKFHATSSQLYHLSGVIDRPFLVEKIIYEFSASYHTGSMASDYARGATSPTSTAISGANMLTLADPGSFTDQSISPGSSRKLLTSYGGSDGADGTWGAPISTFFILNQRRPNNLYLRTQQNMVPEHDAMFGDITSFTNAGKADEYPLHEPVTTASIPAKVQLSKNGPTVYVDTIRDIVTFAQVSAMGASYTDANKEKLVRDLNIYGLVDSDPLWEGAYVISSSIKSPVINPTIVPMFMGCNDSSTYYVVFNDPGGRSGNGSPTGRDLVSSVLGHNVSSTFDVLEPELGALTSVTQGKKNFAINPYILLPTDSLVFGWQVPIGRMQFAEGRVGPIVEGESSRLVFNPGKGRLILFGSLIQQNSEFHDTLNQPLTSLAVHEDIHIDNPVLDQFDTEPRAQFSGSYTGEYITGSLSVTSLLSRKVMASTVSGTLLDDIVFNVGSTTFDRNVSDYELKTLSIPGFSRCLRLSSQTERYFDTILPNIGQIAIINGARVYSGSYGEISRGIIIFGSVNSALTLSTDDTWNRAFPFEPKYSTVSRELIDVMKVNVTHNLSTGNALGKQYLDVANVGRTVEPFDSLGWSWLATNSFAMKDVFGIGLGISGSADRSDYQVVYIGPTAISMATYYPKQRGFKYGILNSQPQYASAVFRRTSYGQFRDMLEQRLDAKFFNIGNIEERQGELASPVQIKFVVPSTNRITQPTKTYCSNLNNEATSSVPYFDGHVKNREEPLDFSNINSSIVTI